MSFGVTKRTADVRFEELSFCTLDFETTGFSPTTCRAVEVAVVVTDSSGHVQAEMHSILNPEIPVDASWIHGITDSDVRGAPTFKDLAPDLVQLINGSVVVAHNAPFDLRFLQAELERSGVYLDSLPYLCTMRMRSYVGLPGSSAHKLAWACWQEGIALPSAHAAVVDARATSELLNRYLQVATEVGATSLGELEAYDASSQSWEFPLPSVSLRARRWLKPRPKPRGGVPLAHAGLKNDVTARPSVIADYRTALSEAMEDFELTEDEIDALQQFVGLLQMTSAEIRIAHEEHLRDLVAVQADDGVFTWTEQQLAKTTASLLGIAPAKLEAMLQEHDAKVEGKLEGAPVAALEGLVVCFTGDFEAIPLTRAEVEEFASSIGLTPHPRVTKKVDLLVCRNPSLQTSKLAKAAEYGTITISQETFLAIAGAAPAPEGEVADLLARVQARRHETKSPSGGIRATRAAPRPSSDERLLWCEDGEHEWTRASQRGRLPRNCPEHA